MSDGMILMNQGAIDALENQAFSAGVERGREEASEEYHLFLREQKALCEVLEVEGDQSLVDAAEHLAAELRAHREAMKVAARRIEQQRETINELRQSLLMHVKETA